MNAGRLKLTALLALAAGALGAALPAPVHAQDATYTLVISGNKFDKEELEVPAGKRFVLVVKNMDKTAEEFESNDLRLEKVVAGGKEIKLNVGPLTPGRYFYFGDYHEDTAKGYLVAK